MKFFFSLFLPLAQRLFALIRKQFENSFSSTFSLICLSPVCICDLNWLFSSTEMDGNCRHSAINPITSSRWRQENHYSAAPKILNLRLLDFPAQIMMFKFGFDHKYIFSMFTNFRKRSNQSTLWSRIKWWNNVQQQQQQQQKHGIVYIKSHHMSMRDFRIHKSIYLRFYHPFRTS